MAAWLEAQARAEEGVSVEVIEEMEVALTKLQDAFAANDAFLLEPLRRVAHANAVCGRFDRADGLVQRAREVGQSLPDGYEELSQIEQTARYVAEARAGAGAELGAKFAAPAA